MISCMRPLLIAGVLIPAVAGIAGPLPDNYTLGKYIPGDAWMYMNFVDDPKSEWIDDEWAGVYEALKSSGIDRDILALLAEALPEEHMQVVEEKIETLDKLCSTIAWNDLVKEELAFAMRVAQLPLPYDYFLLARGKAGTGEVNFKALVALVKELASWTDHVTLTEDTRGDITVWSLRFSGSGHGAPSASSIGASFLRKGDIIGFVTGESALNEVLALLQGKSKSAPIAASARLHSALALVPAPESGLIYFDGKAFFTGFEKLMSGARGMIRTADKGTPPGDAGSGEKGAEAEKSAPYDGRHEGQIVVEMISKLVGMWDFMDYSITTIKTEGRQQITHEVVAFDEAKLDHPMAKVLLNRKAFDRFDRYIPEDATGFQASTMIDLHELYSFAIEFVRKDVPNGEGLLEMWNGLLAQQGFDPQRDLFSWLGGEMMSVFVPPVVVTPMSSGDSVMFVRVTNPEIAQKKLDAALAWVDRFLTTQGQPLTLTPADVGVEGFHEITHPWLVMFMIRPVAGIHGEWMIFASSAGAVKKCLAVAAGEAPSIATNERFKREGLSSDSPVSAISFTDTSNLGQEMAAALGMMGMFGGMATANIPDDEVRQVVQKVFGIAVKLSPVVQKIDFFSSEASVTTRDKNLIKTKRVVTYKPPKSDDKKTVDSTQ